MILDQYPTLLHLDSVSQMQLAAELWEAGMGAQAKFTPEVCAALEERIAYNEAHPDDVFTTEQVTARLAEVKREIDANRHRG